MPEGQEPPVAGVPEQSEVLAKVWGLLQDAAKAGEVDHAACSRYAESLLKALPKPAAAVATNQMDEAIERAREVAELESRNRVVKKP